MTTQTHAELETNTYPGGQAYSVYVRMPAEAQTWLELPKPGIVKTLKMGLATGKHGKFIWIYNPERQASKIENL